MFKRKILVEKIREYLGTPWSHLGRKKQIRENGQIIKKGGIDCVGLIYATCKECGDTEMIDVLGYDRYPSADLFRQNVEMYCEQIEFKNLQPGDLMIFAFDKEPQHIAMVTKVNPIYIIHSYAQARKVVEHLFIRDDWDLRGCYKLKNIEE